MITAEPDLQGITPGHGRSQAITGGHNAVTVSSQVVTVTRAESPNRRGAEAHSLTESRRREARLRDSA